MSDTTSLEQPRSTNGHVYIGQEYDEDEAPDDFVPGNALVPLVARFAVSAVLAAGLVVLIVRRMRANQESGDQPTEAWGA
jgi:hypothetical protein